MTATTTAPITTLPRDAFRIGAALPRVEDQRFLRGLGRYVDDFHFPGETYMCVVRSPHAAARIVSIDPTAALAMDGVLAVLTGADAQADDLGPLRTSVMRKQRSGAPMVEPPYRILCLDTVHFAGDAVAVVVAETRAAAIDAADAVVVDYDTTEAVTDIAEAIKPGAPAVWPDVPNNESFFFELGDRAGAAHMHNTRGLGLANCLAAFDVGVRTFDASLGGLGGCPYAPGASGNVVTEDLVFMFEAMGVATGVDLARLMAARAPLMAGLPGEPIYGMTPEAGLPKGWGSASAGGS